MTDEPDTSGAPAAGPFGTAALGSYDLGLCPMPCGGDDGKRPLIAWAKWNSRPPRVRFAKFLERPAMAAANIGILTGLSGITIVDCDDKNLVGPALELFGETPLITTTPSGGHHLWYRAKGERCRNLRGDGYAIDIKGIGGLSVEPPSIRPSGQFAGIAYRFARGGLENLPALPTISEVAAERFRLRPAAAVAMAPRQVAASGIPAGQRNQALFKKARELAALIESEEALIEHLLLLNAWDCDPPLPDVEVRRTARSAWRMQVEGRNWVAGRGGMTLNFDVIDAAIDPNSFYLLVKLDRCHRLRTKAFTIVPKAMAASGNFAGMSVREIRKARDALLAAGHLVQVHKGGRGARDASLYRLGIDVRHSVSN